MLSKLIDPEIILGILEKLEKKNELPNGITFSTRQYFFADPLMPIYENNFAVGNKLAFELFKNKNKDGFYVSMDINNFKLINNINHEEGDKAIKLIGYTLRKSTINLRRSKLFRSGGDEFVFYSENKEEIYIFINKAIEELNKLDLIDNSIKITLSFGIGKSYIDAEKALLLAKNKKNEISNPIYDLLE
jgi:diguanylate cyclase (GGDEF)-like protein